MTSEAELADRYGAPSAGRRRLLWAGVSAVAAVCLAWLGWTVWFHSTPDVRSDMVTFAVVSTHEATATIEVSVDDGVAATCTVRAYAADHSTVGEKTYTPEDGRNTVAVRTEREATSVENIGCTAPGQPRPR